VDCGASAPFQVGGKPKFCGTSFAALNFIAGLCAVRNPAREPHRFFKSDRWALAFESSALQLFSAFSSTLSNAEKVNMKTSTAAILLSLAAGFSIVAPAAKAQTATPVLSYVFPGDSSVGANPNYGFIQASDGNLYGAAGGGANTYGVIYKTIPSTGHTTVLYECNAQGTDCGGPNLPIELPDGNLYGTSYQGCANGVGCIYKLTLAGVYTDVYDFTDTGDGSYPYGHLIYSPDGNIYGTTSGNLFGAPTNSLGTIFKFNPALSGGTPSLSTIYTFNNATNSGAIGFHPFDGVTEVNGTLYGTTQTGGLDCCGAVWSIGTTGGSTPTLLHGFAYGLDGAFPSGAVRYYKPDGNLYGNTLENGVDPAAQGSIYKTGLNSGFAAVYTFSGGNDVSMAGPPAFDSAGNILVTAGTGGPNSLGAIYAAPRSGNAVTASYTFSDPSVYGYQPLGGPFIDNQGYMWTTQITGGGGTNGTGDVIGTLDKFTLSTETSAPIKISISPTTVAPNTNAKVSWSTSNSFSDDEQFCFGTGNTNSSWNGKRQVGSYANGVYSGSLTTNFSSTGDYVFAITCGGKESALATLHVRLGSATFLTASSTSVPEGNPVTLNVAVTGNGSAATGKVGLSVAGISIGSVTLSNGKGSFTASTAGISPGTYPVLASYPGDLQYTASSQTLNVTVTPSVAPTTTTLTVTPTSIKSGASATVTIAVKASSGTPTGNVSLLDGSTVLATVGLSGGQASFSASTTGYATGTYVLHASYAGSKTDAASTSSNVTVTITK
jgi:uncharacterized repeat protein (TIGR03803 family)